MIYEYKFNGDEIKKGQGVYTVYCDVYRDGIRIKQLANLCSELVVMDREDEGLEDTLFDFADECLRKYFERRIAEDVLQDPVACGDVAKGGSVQFEFTEPNYGKRVVEIYDNFNISEVVCYKFCTLPKEEQIEIVKMITPHLLIPSKEEVRPSPYGKVPLEEVKQKLRDLGIELRSDDEE